MYKKNKSPFAKTAAKQNLCPAPTMEGNPQKQDVDLLHPRSTLSTHPCWKPSGVESRTALASRATRGPGARSCCSLSLPAAPLQNTATSKIPVWARGSLHVSAPTTISHGREEEGQAASALVNMDFPPLQTRGGLANLEKTVKCESPNWKNRREIIQRSCVSFQINRWCSPHRER